MTRVSGHRRPRRLAYRSLETDEHLVQHDVVEDRDPRALPRAVRPSAGRARSRARSGRRARPAERPERGQDGEPAGPTRRLGHPVVGSRSAAGRLDVVGGPERHRRVMRAASRTNTSPESYGTLSHLCASVDHESAPVVAAHPVAQRRARPPPRSRTRHRCGPSAPRSWAIGTISSNGSNAPRVHVAGLGADDRSGHRSWPGPRAGRRAHPALVVGGDPPDAVALAAQTEHLERRVDRDVGALVGHDRDRRRALQTVPLHVPAGPRGRRGAPRRGP